MTATICVPREVGGVCSCRLGARRQAADVVITQPVEHEGDQVAGGGHDADVAAASLRDPVPTFPEPGMSGHPLYGLDRGPAHQSAALFICGTRDVNPAGDVVFDLLRRGGWVRQDGGWGPGSGAARPRSGRRAWMPTPGLTHHRRHCGEDHSAAVHRRGMITPGGGWACSPVSGCVGRPCLSGCSATKGPVTRWRSGCLDGVRPLVLGRLSSARAGSNRVAGS
jgi:hypothetical protein